MNKPAIWQKVTLVAMLIAAFALFAACGNNGTNGNDVNGDDNDNQVAGASQKMEYGYILEVNPQAKTILVESFRMVPQVDQAALEREGLTADSEGFYNGYYLTAGGSRMLYPLADSVDLRLSDLDYSTNGYYLDRYGMRNSAEWLESQGGQEAADSGMGDNSPSAATDGVNDLTEQNNTFGADKDALNDTNTAAGNNNVKNNDAANSVNKGNNALDNNNLNNNNTANNGLTSDLTDNRAGNNYTNDTWRAYSGNDISYLNTRIGAYQHIPFCIYLENGKVVRIVEMDTIYR